MGTWTSTCDPPWTRPRAWASSTKPRRAIWHRPVRRCRRAAIAVRDVRPGVLTAVVLTAVVRIDRPSVLAATRLTRHPLMPGGSAISRKTTLRRRQGRLARWSAMQQPMERAYSSPGSAIPTFYLIDINYDAVYGSVLLLSW